MGITYNISQELNDGNYFFSRLQLLEATQCELVFDWHQKRLVVDHEEVVDLEYMLDPDAEWSTPYFRLITKQDTAKLIIHDLASIYGKPKFDSDEVGEDGNYTIRGLKLKGETEKSLKCDLRGWFIWLPISQVLETKESDSVPDAFDVKIPVWLATNIFEELTGKPKASEWWRTKKKKK